MRKLYLALFLIMVSKLAFLPSEASAQTHDSIVIGAGISGLAAAADLHHENIPFLVLEARDRLGGRIWTDRSMGAPCDLGASWIHHSGPTNPITIEANKLKIPRKKTTEDSTERWDENGVIMEEKQVKQLWDQEVRFMKKVEKRRDQLDTDISLAEVMKQVDQDFYEDAEANHGLTWDIETEYGGALEELSAMYYDADSEFPGNTEELFPTGYDTLIQGMAKPFANRILQNKVVNRVDYTNPENITVACEDGSVYYTRTLIITVPLGVLKAGTIKFEPELPKKHSDSIRKLGMGVAINKIFMKFDTDFWSEESKETFFSSTSGGTPETRGKFPQFVNGKKVFGVNVLLGFAFSTYAKAMENKTNEEIKNDAMLSLKKIFPKAKEPVAYVLSRWFSDPYSRGAYSYAAVGSTPADFNNLKQPINEQIHLAGEHCIQEYKSSVHGAYISGKRASAKVLKYLHDHE